MLGPVNVAASVPYHASQMLSRNLASLLGLLVKDGELRPDPGDPIVQETLVAQGGEVVHPRVREKLGLAAPAPAGAG